MKTLLTIACAIAAANALADDIFVPGDFATIQEAIDAAMDGDHVVLAGMFNESAVITGKSITVQSDGGEVVLDGAGLGAPIMSVFGPNAAGSTFQGLTFINGEGSPNGICGAFGRAGGAVYAMNAGAIVFDDCTFIDNAAFVNVPRGGAIGAEGTAVQILGCDFQGNGAAPDETAFGGAVLVCDGDSLVISSTSFQGNVASFGGGVLAEEFETVQLTDCICLANEAAHGGGFNIAECQDVLIQACEFIDNVASHGGGVIAQTQATLVLSDSLFQQNAAAFGAGFNITVGNNPSGTSVSADINDCQFVDNVSGFGGGVFGQVLLDNGFPLLPSPTLTVARSTFTGNSATCCEVDVGIYGSPCWLDGLNVGTFYGGGADLRSLDGGTIRVHDSLFADNFGTTASGLHVSTCGEPEHDLFGGWIDLVNNTIADHTGVGLYARIGRSGFITADNMIVHANDEQVVTLLKQPVEDQASFDMTYSIVQGGFEGEGNLDLDPAFVGDGDYRLSPGSPAIDAADNTAVDKATIVDIAGAPRFVDDPDTIDTGIGPRAHRRHGGP